MKSLICAVILNWNPLKLFPWTVAFEDFVDWAIWFLVTKSSFLLENLIWSYIWEVVQQTGQVEVSANETSVAQLKQQEI
jgi:hypothetical protein